MKKEYRVTGSGYDLGAGEIGRISRMLFLDATMPLGNLGGGTSRKRMGVLWLSHRLGHLLFPLMIPFEQRLHALHARIRQRFMK